RLREGRAPAQKEHGPAQEMARSHSRAGEEESIPAALAVRGLGGDGEHLAARGRSGCLDPVAAGARPRYALRAFHHPLPGRLEVHVLAQGDTLLVLRHRPDGPEAVLEAELR